MSAIDAPLLSRVEDASLNASAPPQQRWLDGWIVRTHPGKARRARCINAVAAGRLHWHDKLPLAQAMFAEVGMPLVMRITAFTEPATLDAELQAAGWSRVGDTQVWVCCQLPATENTLPPGLHWRVLDADPYAAVVGRLRGSPEAQCQAHAERLRLSPVPYRGFALQDDSGSTLACGQFAREGRLVGLYDVFTHPQARNQGLARLLCERLLFLAANEGAQIGYLQVESDNLAAQAVYRRLGFEFGYGYHYREPPPGAGG